MRDDSQGSSNGPTYLKKNSDNDTFGSTPVSRSKRRYGRMQDDSILEMTGNFDGKEQAQESIHEITDDGSERAIWQTRTVTVHHGQK